MTDVWVSRPWKRNRNGINYQEFEFSNLTIRRYVGNDGAVWYKDGHGTDMSDNKARIELTFRSAQIAEIEARTPRSPSNEVLSTPAINTLAFTRNAPNYVTSGDNKDTLQIESDSKTTTALAIREPPTGSVSLSYETALPERLKELELATANPDQFSPSPLEFPILEGKSSINVTQTRSNPYRIPGERRRSYGGSHYSKGSSWKTIGGELPESFQEQSADFFAVGRFIEVVLSEPMGEHARKNSSNGVSQVFYHKARPLIVIRKYHAHCICVPVYTYGGQGVLKPGLHRSEIRQHAALFNETESHCIKEDEHRRGLRREKIAMTIPENQFGYRLDPMSRVRFDCFYTIQYDWPVRGLGMVADKPSFLRQINQPA